MNQLKNISVIIGVCAGIFAAIQSYAIVPYRVAKNEESIKEWKSKYEADHDLIVKMSSDLSYIKQIIERK